ncbi:hypothetical protein QQS21_007415 [Conoideocrella luteorostrata]|uniref:BZIP transcription factor n=1 Tax=Conoideocrella luteorostrata TaxID=1105319 RepID=A0AAJ0CL47_9HYPO|nr:hypothetical protein QQS21_007415 [Conoideocrella luteorostrata]
MASAASDIADSPDVRSPGPSTPAGGGGTGIKRGPDDEPTDAEQAQGAGAKKKKTGLASRGVANLTPEQLAKKRANDREAQRAIRERTKNQIETLERRILELTNQKPYQELQAVIRAKEAVEKENADIKRQLASVMNILKPIVCSEADDSAHSPRPHPCSQSQSGNASQSPSSHPHCAPTPTPRSSVSPATISGQPHQHASPGWSDSQNTSPDAHSDMAITQLHNQRLQLRQGLHMGGEKLGLDFLLRPGQHVSQVQAGLHGAQDTPQYHHVPMKHDWVASNSNSQGYVLPVASRLTEAAGHNEYNEQPQEPSAPQPSQPHQSPHPSYSSLPFYAIPIKNSESSCPLDTILLNFLSERRQRIAEGLPMHEVVGPRYPSVSSLLNPAKSAYSHPLSKLFTDVLARFPDISRLPERVAVLYIMFLVMRWQISPTHENYERLPDWMTPRQSQLECPHPAWIDHVPFPAMRDRLARIYKPGEYELEQFFIPYTTTLRVNWPYEETDTLLMLPDSPDVIINPVFERHLRNINNWTLGSAFARAFPALADTFGLSSPT